MIRLAVAAVVVAFTNCTAHPAITVSSRHPSNARYVVSVSTCHLVEVVCYAVVINIALCKKSGKRRILQLVDLEAGQDEQSQETYSSLDDDVLQGVLLHSTMTFRTNLSAACRSQTCRAWICADYGL